MAGRRDVEAGSAYVHLYMKQTAWSRGVRTLKRNLQEIGRKFTAVGRQAAAVGAAMVAAIGMATRTFAGFDDKMRAVKAVTGATAVEFQKLTDLAKLLGRTTSFTAQEVADAMLNLSRAGFGTAETEAATASVLALARATGTELAESAEIAAGILRSFSMDAAEMGRVSDVLTATANNSSQTLTDLGESMKYAAPIADEYGMTLEETAKSLGVMANMQIKGSMAGTGLRKMMGQLADPAIQKQLDAMGISALDASRELRPLGDIMVDVGKKMEGMTGAERITLAKTLFGDRAFGGALKLTKGGFDELAKAIDNAGGTADRTAETMDSGIGGAFRRFMSAFEGVQIAIGNALSGALTKWADKLAEVAGRITKFIDEHQDFIIQVGVAAVALLGMGTALIGTGAAMTALSGILGAVLNPVVLGIGVAVVAAGAAFLTWKDEILTAVMPTIRELADIFRDDVLPAILELKPALVDLTEEIGNLLKESGPLIEFFGGALKAQVKTLAVWLNGVAIALKEIVDLSERMRERQGMVPHFWDPMNAGKPGGQSRGDGIGGIPRLGVPGGGGTTTTGGRQINPFGSGLGSGRPGGGGVSPFRPMTPEEIEAEKSRQARKRLDARRREIEDAERAKQQNADAIAATHGDVARARVMRDKDGLAEALGLLDLDKQRELEGVGSAEHRKAIMEKYAIEADLAKQSFGKNLKGDVAGPSGTFSTAAALAMAGGGDPQERAAKAAETQVDLTRDLIDKTVEQNETFKRLFAYS